MKTFLVATVSACFLLAAGCAPDPMAGNNPPAKKELPAPLKARLIANKTEYALPVGGKTLKEYRQVIDGVQPIGGDRPPAPEVDLVFELTNTSDKDLDVELWIEPSMELKGPDVRDKTQYGMNCIPPPPTRIKAGETHKMPIKQLTYFAGKGSHTLYWTKAGEYELSMTLNTSYRTASDDPKAKYEPIRFTPDPVKLKVVEGKEDAPIPGTGKREDRTPKPAVKIAP